MLLPGTASLAGAMRRMVASALAGALASFAYTVIKLAEVMER